MAVNVQIVDANTMVGVHPTHRLDMSIERLVREMDRHKIAASLTLSAIGVFDSYAVGNAATLSAAKANNRLVPIATVNPKNYFGSAADMQAVRSQGFRIVKFYPAEQGWAIDSAAFGEILKQLAPLKMPLMVDAPNPGEPSAIGCMAADYPAPVILCSVSLDTLAEALAVMTERQNIMLETHDIHVPGALAMVAGRVSADRIVFGSGAPRLSIASSLHYVLSSELSDDDEGRVLGGNIKRILEVA